MYETNAMAENCKDKQLFVEWWPIREGVHEQNGADRVNQCNMQELVVFRWVEPRSLQKNDERNP